MRGGSLCSGSGGLDLGLERALGVEWAWHCESDEAASAILSARWPGVPNYGDLFETDWSVVERVDIIAAGFPCPDYSFAGRRAGIDGEHGQVWLAVAAALRVLRPRYVVLENVDGIRSAAGPVDGGPGDTAVGVVLADLADLGYRWAYDRIRAADVGAPHGRLRWFCVAALPSAADPVGVGVDADGRVPGRDQGAPRPRGPAPSAVPAGPEVDGAEDALEDGPGAATDAVGERRDGGGVGDEGAPAGGGEDRGAVAARPAAPPRLLPTPTAGDGKASGSRNLEGSKAHAGVSLTDAVQTGGSTTPRLLPTPQAADGDGGRQERGAMTNDGVRPSGQKATLPLPTAVAMRDELTETPFARPGADQLELLPTPTGYVGESVEGQLSTEVAMLPTPVANPDNPGAGGELRAALVHGEGRRNETGVDTLGRPNRGRAAPPLLPTPTTQDAANTAGPSQRDRHSEPLNVVAVDLLPPPLLPTPQTGNRRSRKAMTSSTENGRRSGGGNSSPPGLEQIAEIRDGRWPEELPPYDQLPPATRAIIDSLLAGDLRPEIQWGVYEPAVRRWEDVFGEDAPAPTDEKGRLAPEFVEWMLGYPPGWFDVEGVSRTRKLRALGNSVQVQVAEAVGYWFAALLESGLLA